MNDQGTRGVFDYIRVGAESAGCVRGACNLRVVDCSIMPGPVSGNTDAPAMAVAWHASDLILEDRGPRS